jgi:hypothetical protein
MSPSLCPSPIHSVTPSKLWCQAILWTHDQIVKSEVWPLQSHYHEAPSLMTEWERPWGLPSLLYNGYRVSYQKVKWLEWGADHSLPSSSEVKERVELYPYPLWAFMACNRTNFTVYLLYIYIYIYIWTIRIVCNLLYSMKWTCTVTSVISGFVQQTIPYFNYLMP